MSDFSDRRSAADDARARSAFESGRPGQLRAALDRSRNPILIADDQRRWVTGNSAACALLGISPAELPWRTMDDFTPAGDLSRLEEQWLAFLRSGEAAGRYELYVPDRGPVPLEFSAIAHVLPARHLSVFMPIDDGFIERAERPAVRESRWAPVVTPVGRVELTKREREVMMLIASGGHSADIAARLFVSPDTIKSHVHNAMGKLGARTRAHAVAIAMVTDQIAWTQGDEKPHPPGSGDLPL